jgi:nucleoside-diphosphate-sugar epimerase
VGDICRAFLHAAAILREYDSDPAQPAAAVYAISGGQRRTLREVAATLEEAAGARLSVQFGALPYREREVMTPWIGPALPGWKPQIKLLDGLKALLDVNACEGAPVLL